MREIVLIANNLRSCHNVGSLLRTAEGLGVNKVWLVGYTPYPLMPNDPRLPHLAIKINKQISKTALGAEMSQSWDRADHIEPLISDLKSQGFEICAVEQSVKSIKLPDYKPTQKIALIMGREVDGVEPEILELCDKHLEIPMFGKKESFNVVQAAAIALYHCRFS